MTFEWPSSARTGERNTPRITSDERVRVVEIYNTEEFLRIVEEFGTFLPRSASPFRAWWLRRPYTAMLTRSEVIRGKEDESRSVVDDLPEALFKVP